MNIDDLGTQQEEFMRDIALRKRQPMLEKTGSCYNCGESVKQNANFCGKDCRYDHERRTENAKGK